MHSKVRNGGLKRNATSTYIWRLAADWTDTHWWTYKHHLSFFCVKLQFVALHPWQSIAYTGLNVGLSRSEIARWCTVRDFCVISVLVIVTVVTCYDIRGCEYRVNSTGPRTDPWGTPKTRGIGVDIKPSTTTGCVLSLRYDSNQDSATPEIPKVLSSRLNRMAWSRVSKAALRSNSASIDTSFWSDFVRRPSNTLKTAVSVLWYFLYADCRISSEQFAHRWDCSWRLPSLVSSKRMGDLRLVWHFLNH